MSYPRCPSPIIFPLPFALTYRRRFSCPLPRPLIRWSLVRSLVASYLLESCPLIGCHLVVVVVIIVVALV